MYLASIEVDGYRAAANESITCNLPGRFAVLLGANGTGKSTVTDALSLAHSDVFPWAARPTADSLRKDSAARIRCTYSYETIEAIPKWADRRARGIDAPGWEVELRSSLGQVSPSLAPGTPTDTYETRRALPLLYLAATRNPHRDLAGRQSRLVVEILRAEARRAGLPKSLAGLKRHLRNLVATIVSSNNLLPEAEARVSKAFEELTAGVSGKKAYLATLEIDEAFIAQVLEFYAGAVSTEREDARRLELQGLGYANLLQVAVMIAAIPDLSATESSQQEHQDDGGDETGIGSQLEPVGRANPDEVGRDLLEAAEDSRAIEDAFFPDQFHATLVLEEPEAHLHPQLQHGLLRYLRRVVQSRPELQVIVTTHSDEVASVVDPDELVVFRRQPSGRAVVITVAELPLEEADRRMTARHLDVAKASALFAEHVLLVEGITDAIVLRAFAQRWSAADPVRQAFVDALTITVIGSRVGPWLPRLLLAPGHEIASRVGVVMDSDGRKKPRWASRQETQTPDRFKVVLNEPTLEPALFEADPEGVYEVLQELGFDSSSEGLPSTEEVSDWFKEAGRRNKARFAEDIVHRLSAGHGATPPHFLEVFDFLFDGFESDYLAGGARGEHSESNT